MLDAGHVWQDLISSGESDEHHAPHSTSAHKPAPIPSHPASGMITPKTLTETCGYVPALLGIWERVKVEEYRTHARIEMAFLK